METEFVKEKLTSAKKLDYETFLSTNGIFLEKLNKEQLDLIDIILPPR